MTAVAMTPDAPIAWNLDRLKSGRYRVRIGHTIRFTWPAVQTFVPYEPPRVRSDHQLLVTLTPELLAAIRRRRSRREPSRTRSAR